jgi:hypothetical protein
MKRYPIILLIVLLQIMQLRAQTTNPDTTVVDMEFKDMSLKQVLNDISEKYDVRFSYSDTKLNSEMLVSGIYRKTPLQDFLVDFFSSNDINYSIIDNQIVLFPFSTDQTIKIKGKVINQLDGSPIPFANISLTETNKGTSSNEEGEFEIVLSGFPSELLISHLAHEKKLVYVYDDQDELIIELTPAPKELKEVTIRSRGNKNAYYQLLNRAYDKLAKIQNSHQYGKAFYRQKSSREDRHTEIFEIFYDIKYSAVGIEDWAVQEGRYAFQQDKDYDIFLYNKNFTLLSRMFPVLQPATDSYIMPVNQEVKKYFDLTLSDIIRYENRYIAILDYKPKPIVDKPAPSGQLFIDFDDYSILKMTGRFTDTSLEIIGFSDTKSDWDNYNLDFEVSFIDDHSDMQQLDFIKINHSFDYYFNQKFVGRINTSSFLTFYEQYTPAKNKKLGGAIDYRTSDMEIIDRVGYNPVFWKRNPIVKRTPLEEKLIMDFEQNEAFGVVFMNNEEEVVLLPDTRRSEISNKLIADFESSHVKDSIGQMIYLRTDKNQFTPDEKINFTAYIYDKWTFRPLVLGSVLTVDLKNAENKLVISKNFDIINGAAYGELELKDVTTPGVYSLDGYTNIDRQSASKRYVSISPFPQKQNNSDVAGGRDVQKASEFVVQPESGILLAGIPTHIVFKAPQSRRQPASGIWNIRDDAGNIIHSVTTDPGGVGSFTLTPVFGKKYFIGRAGDEELTKSPLPEVVSSGTYVHIDTERDRSVGLEIYQKPALPNDVFILSVFRGKVLTVFKASLQGIRNTIDLPIQHLRGGVNDLIILDKEGAILAARRFFNPAEKINIDLLSARWKSKRSHRLELVLQVSNSNGKPILPNLSAVFYNEGALQTQKCDIRNDLLLNGLGWAEKIDFDLSGDSLYQTLDKLLILESRDDPSKDTGSPLTNGDFGYTANSNYGQISEPLVAEVSVSGSLSSQAVPSKKIKSKKNDAPESEIFWVPKLFIDDKGIAVLEIKVPDKNQKINVNIQGLSENGLIGNSTLSIDPSMIKTDKKPAF